jgi:hypothetical protein
MAGDTPQEGETGGDNQEDVTMEWAPRRRLKRVRGSDEGERGRSGFTENHLKRKVPDESGSDGDGESSGTEFQKRQRRGHGEICDIGGKSKQ